MSTTIVTPYVGAVLETPGGELALTCCLSYTTGDPLAVTFTFVMDIELDSGCMARDVQSWTVARELLEAAMAQPDTDMGQGDVRLHLMTAQAILVMTLLDLDGHSHDVYIDAAVIPMFLDETESLVPADAELTVVDDDEIARLLWEGK